MKIGMYLQDYEYSSWWNFRKVLQAVKKSDLDLLVFPEHCYNPNKDDFNKMDISNLKDKEKAEEYAVKISKKSNCAVIITGLDKYNMIYSIFANAKADETETKTAIYFKHIATHNSPLENENYGEDLSSIFKCVILKNMRIGMTICYESNNAAFSRAYYKDGVDIIVNSTGGNVDYNKWYRYNKVRAIENNCFNFCTMGYDNNDKENSYTFGFTPQGKLMKSKPLLEYKGIENIFEYDTEEVLTGGEDDITLNQKETESKNGTFSISVTDILEMLSKENKVSDNLWSIPIGKENLIVCLLEEKDILLPEKNLALLYHKKLKDIKDKRYLILNKWKKVDTKYFNTVLSDVLKVRAMENFCAVLIITDAFSKCYQTGKTKVPQVVLKVKDKYTFDFERMTGPESFWRKYSNLGNIKWRNGYEKIIEYIETIS